MNLTFHSHKSGATRISRNLIGGLRRSLEEIDSIDSTKGLRRAITSSLRESGWSGQTRVDSGSKISITAMNQGVALCLQTGNMGRFYADLLKLQCLYKKRTASAGVFLVLGTRTARKLGSNLVNYERLVGELDIFRSIISIPLYVIGLDGRTP